MFLLVSEVCVPLHHPALMWSQLMAESHVSRATGRTEDMQVLLFFSIQLGTLR